MYRYSPYGRGKARKGEGWHKRGWRDWDGSMAVNITFSPKCYGSHTLEVQPHETAARIRMSAINTQCDDVNLRGRHVMLVHKKRELVGAKTAADYGIESADTLYLKLFDTYGNQLRWDNYGFVKEFGCDDDNYGILARAFSDDPYTDERPADVRPLAKAAGVDPGYVTDWFMWRRSVEEVGGDEPGDRGRVAHAERRAEHASGRADAAAWAAAQAQAQAAQAQAQAARLAQLQVRQQQMALSVYGEMVSLRPDAPGAPWYNVQPSHMPATAPLLDTGNGAATMISVGVARAAGIRAGQNSMTINGVNGQDDYPMAYCRVQIRGIEQRICAAIGGEQGILVGRDVIEPMLDIGYTIAGFSAVRGHGGQGAYRIEQL